MRVLIIDSMAATLELAIRASDWGHKVRYWRPKVISSENSVVGKGYVDLVTEWEPSMDWADLIITTDNAKYQAKLEPYFEKGYPIFGCNQASAALELDREIGQTLLKKAGIPVLPYDVFDDFDSAIEYVKKTKKPYACKPWGGAAGSDDKALSYVAKDAKSLIYQLEKWKKEDVLKGGKFILQKAVKGIEMAVGCWFGPGGWGKWKLENFEEKKFMNDGYGVNTGEQGTIIRYVEESKLFDEVLAPVAQALHALNYVGYVDMNCIIDPKTGEVWPLEFTMRFGWPLIYIQMMLHRGDPVEWMLDLLEGRDTLKVSKKVCVGIVLTHADFPHTYKKLEEVSGFPVFGLEEKDRDNVCYCDLKVGKVTGDDLKEMTVPVSAGRYLLVVDGVGDTVADARCDVYGLVDKIHSPTNIMCRTDIGKRLEKQLPLLHKFGYAKGLDYGKDS